MAILIEEPQRVRVPSSCLGWLPLFRAALSRLPQSCGAVSVRGRLSESVRPHGSLPASRSTFAAEFPPGVGSGYCSADSRCCSYLSFVLLAA